MKPNSFFLFSIGLATVFCVSSGNSVPAATAPHSRFALTDLGTLPGGYETFPNKINNLGQVAGSTVDAGGARRPFIYGGGAIMAIPGVANGIALGINDSGAVVGQMSGARGFLFSQGVLTDLNPIVGVDWVAASGINAAGQIVGWTGERNGVFPSFWLNHGVVGFFPMSSNAYYTTVYAINNSGQAVGDSGVFTKTFMKMRAPFFLPRAGCTT